jgi:hypothetical protein
MNTGPAVNFFQRDLGLLSEISLGLLTSWALKVGLVTVPPIPGPAPAPNGFTEASYPGYAEQTPSLGSVVSSGIAGVFDRASCLCSTVTFTGPTSGPPVVVYGYFVSQLLNGSSAHPAYYVPFPVPLQLTTSSSTIVIAAPEFCIRGNSYDGGVTYTP